MLGMNSLFVDGSASNVAKEFIKNDTMIGVSMGSARAEIRKLIASNRVTTVNEKHSMTKVCVTKRLIYGWSVPPGHIGTPSAIIARVL